MSAKHRTPRRQRRWPTRRSALLLGVLAPTAASAWLEGADAVLARAEAKWRPAPIVLDLQIRWRDGQRSQTQWSLGPAPTQGLAVFDPSGPAGFGRAVVNTLYTQGVGALVDGFAVDPDRRRMALINQRPCQVIGRAHGDTADRPAIWLDHQRLYLLQVASGAEELRLFDWDWTSMTPAPNRLEYHREGRWQWVAAVAVRR